jgi:hypothetical protein
MTPMKRLAVIVCIFFLLFGVAAAQDELAVINFLVLKDDNGKPIRNAAVVLHPVNKKGKQERGGLELKADAEGKASYDGVPYGKLRVQVLAPGFQTFGQDYEIDQREKEITVRLKRPVRQYSIYRDNQNDKKDEGKPAEPGSKEPENKPR